MKKEKKYQLIITLVVVIFTAAFIGFYVSPLSINNNTTQEERNDKMPENLLEGVLSDFNNESIVVKVNKPSELKNEKLELLVHDNTKYEEMVLKVYNLNDVKNTGSNEIQFEELETGEEVLVAVNSNLLEWDGKNQLEASKVTLISEKEMD